MIAELRKDNKNMDYIAKEVNKTYRKAKNRKLSRHDIGEIVKNYDITKDGLFKHCNYKYDINGVDKSNYISKSQPVNSNQIVKDILKNDSQSEYTETKKTNQNKQVLKPEILDNIYDKKKKDINFKINPNTDPDLFQKFKDISNVWQSYRTLKNEIKKGLKAINQESKIDILNKVYWELINITENWIIETFNYSNESELMNNIQPNQNSYYCECGNRLKASTREEVKEFYKRYLDAKKPLCHECKIVELRAMDYQDYLRSEHWQSTKLRKLESVNYKCEISGQDSFLHVHHKTYDNLGCELDSDLIVLHQDVHNLFHKHFKNDGDLWIKKGRD
jgi:hypothetical protein